MSEPLENVEKELEVFQPETPITVKSDSVSDTLWLADNIDKIVEAQKKIFNGILKITIPGDFVSFGAGPKEKVELVGAACERVGRDLGVSLINRKETYEEGSDAIGSYYRYIYRGDAVWRGRTIEVMSVASSRTKFHGKEHGKYKEIAEVSRDDVQTAAYRGLFKEAVKALFGLRHLNRAELEKAGITIVGSAGHEFASREEKAADSQSATVTIESVTSKAGPKWTLYTISDTEGVKYTTFSKSLADAAQAAQKDGSAVPVVFTKDKYGLKLISINGVSDAA